MVIERLNKTELKVLLTAADMKQYTLDGTPPETGSADPAHAFRSILDEARKKTGFDTVPNRICIRIYPDTDGGCAMYVTKLPDGDPKESTPSDSRYLPESQTPAEPEKSGHPDPVSSAPPSSPVLPHGTASVPDEASFREDPQHGCVVYALDITETEELLNLCALLWERGYRAPSEVFVTPGGRFFLTVTEYPPSRGHHAVPETGTETRTAPAAPGAILEEYGTRIASPAMRLNLLEHARCIAPDHGVERLAKMVLTPENSLPLPFSDREP